MSAVLGPAATVDNADKRAAIDMSVKLSVQLMATALGMLTVEGALLIFALTYRELSSWGVISGLLAAACFLYSIFCAGKGITLARNDGIIGNWNVQVSKSKFNQQALFGLIGLAFLLAMLSAALTSPARAKGADETALQNEILELRRSLDDQAKAASAADARQRVETDNLRKELAALRSQIGAPAACKPAACPAPKPQKKK
ncbi:hypothetical protein WKW80_03615 [Variovorax humicola]|uniref:Uncharacterized protein n=1 Tax=Variovorax humicola TaxID=1769758 RepID=A0ABU8VTK1_9BURK